MFSIAPRIETDRLRLRPGRLADKDIHIAMWADARVTRFIGGEPSAPDVSWGKFLSSAGLWPVMGFGYRVFADRASDALIGMGGLRSAEHPPELPSLMRNTYAVLRL